LHPNPLAWVKQQIRQVPEWAKCHRCLLHDKQHDCRLAARTTQLGSACWARLMGGQVRATCRSVLIRSGQNATGAIGAALAGEVTIARLPVSGAASGSRGVRR